MAQMDSRDADDLRSARITIQAEATRLRAEAHAITRLSALMETRAQALDDEEEVST